MKRIAIFAAAVLLAGCATDMSRYYDVQAKAIEADNNAVMALAAAAASGNQGAIVALALRQNSGSKIVPPQDKALQWASILVPSLTNIYGINRNAAISMKQIDAEVEQYTTTMSTLGAIANKGMDEAGKVTFPPVYSVPMGSAPAAPVAPTPEPTPVPAE